MTTRSNCFAWVKVFFCLFMLSGLCMPAFAKRLALVIGNDNYTTVTKLKKAGNDASAMAAELRNAGFEVSLHKDLTYRAMVKAVDAFTSGITGGDEVVVFFAGHGVQLKSGNYLLPTDIEPDSAAEVEKTAYALDDLKDKLSDAKPAFSLVIADACRAPLEGKVRAISGGRGLSAVEPAKGQMVVYSASRGQEALDRLSNADTNPNSVFTREFIVRMKQPGVRIEDIVREVQDAVEQLAKTVKHEQRPALYNEARGNFYFYAPKAGQQNTSTASSSSAASNANANNNESQREENFWNDAKAAGNKEAFEAYLKKYPNGTYVSLAQANIKRLTGTADNTTANTSQSSAANNARIQSPEFGVIYSDDCDLKLTHYYKYAVSWIKHGNDIFQKTYYFSNENTDLDKIEVKFDENNRGSFKGIEKDYSETYQFNKDSVRQISYVSGGKEWVREGIDTNTKLPTRMAYKCAAGSFMAKEIAKLNLSNCPLPDSPYIKSTRCFSAVDDPQNKQIYIGTMLNNKANGWGILMLETGDKYVGMWDNEENSALFQGLHFDANGKLRSYNDPIMNYDGFQKNQITMNDIPEELRFEFTLPGCKKINYGKDLPTVADKNACLAVLKTPDGSFGLGEFKNGILNGKFIGVSPAQNSSYIISTTMTAGAPSRYTRGANINALSWQGEMRNGEKAPIGKFRFITSKRSKTIGEWRADGVTANFCVYGADESPDDIGEDLFAGKCYSGIKPPASN